MRKSHHQENELIQMPKFNTVRKKKNAGMNMNGSINMKGKKEGILSTTILSVK